LTVDQVEVIRRTENVPNFWAIL